MSNFLNFNNFIYLYKGFFFKIFKFFFFIFLFFNIFLLLIFLISKFSFFFLLKDIYFYNISKFNIFYFFKSSYFYFFTIIFVDIHYNFLNINYINYNDLEYINYYISECWNKIFYILALNIVDIIYFNFELNSLFYCLFISLIDLPIKIICDGFLNKIAIFLYRFLWEDFVMIFTFNLKSYIFYFINNFLFYYYTNIINFTIFIFFFIKININYFINLYLFSIYNSLNYLNLSILLIPFLHIISLILFKINKKISLILTIFKFNISILYFYFLNIFEINTNIFYIIDWSFFFNINFTFGIDFISLSFIFLSDLLNILCLLLIWSNIKYKKISYEILLIFCNLLLSFIFLSIDLFIFYIFFELILIPMFFLISRWGSRLRKIHASIQFFLYTLIGSLLFLFGLIYININYNTTDLLILKYLYINNQDQILLFLTFFLAFAIKVPIYPFHLWLPEAHVEAPTAGSVLLAGILLKLGTYGFLKIFFLILPYGSLYFLPIINMLCILGIIFSSFTILRQIDIKKIIAYSSIIHMNYTILGLFNYSFYGFAGSYFLMLSHGIISSALFICIGFLYERYHTRIIFYYGNIVMIMPFLSIYFFLFTLGNIGFPGTSSFIGEFLIFLGLFQSNLIIALFTLIGLFISVIYSFLLYNKIFFYNNLNKNNFIIKYSDLNKREFFILFILLILMFFYGFYTKSFLNSHYFILNDLYLNSKYSFFFSLN
jgi:proton-translocating NADH-quinone oxidoreductase chain M